MRVYQVKQKKSLWLAWWYLALAIGFTLLGVSHWITGDRAWLIGIRFVLAAGFGVLSRMTFAETRKPSNEARK
jgi:hypothetical protein